MRPYLRDPAAIYAESFATVAREARLDRFGPAMAQLATRVIHSCGMIEVADRLAFSPNVTLWSAVRRSSVTARWSPLASSAAICLPKTG
jgi:precorrin isomerase